MESRESRLELGKRSVSIVVPELNREFRPRDYALAAVAVAVAVAAFCDSCLFWLCDCVF